METARCKAFLYAVETGTITGAAEKLNYTASGVSQLIQAMEKELDLKLLHRNKKGVAVTEAGELFVPVVREFLRQEEAIAQLASDVHGLSVGTVTIASYPSIATHWLPKVIRKFQQNYPNIEIQIMEGIRQEVDQWLGEKKADMAFTSYKTPMPYEWIPLADDPMVALLNKSHPLANADKYPIRNIVNEDVFIMPALGSDADVKPLLEKYGLDPEMDLRTGETFPVIAMVEQNIGMSIVNKLITERLEFDGAKVPIDPPNNITLGIAVNSLKSASPAARKFIDVAVDTLRS